MRLPASLVLATGNPGKRDEWAALLEPLGVVLLDPPAGLPEVEETGTTVVENALLKARSVAAHVDAAVLADDVGLDLVALDGAPGVALRRWADGLGGWEAALGVASGMAGSRATYRCGLALILPGEPARVAEGAVAGTLIEADGPGVGLEPCFRPDGAASSLATLAHGDRARLHHRHRALQGLLAG